MWYMNETCLGQKLTQGAHVIIALFKVFFLPPINIKRNSGRRYFFIPTTKDDHPIGIDLKKKKKKK